MDEPSEPRLVKFCSTGGRCHIKIVVFKYLCTVTHFTKREKMKRYFFHKLAWVWHIKTNLVQFHSWECGEWPTNNVQVTLKFKCRSR